MQTQLHAGIAFDELLDRRRQGVARLRVRGCDGQVAAVLRVKFLGGLLEVLGIVQHALGDGKHGFARLGDGHDALAVAHEDLDTQFLLQLPDLLADAGLRGVQRAGGTRDIQSLTHDLVEVTQLLQIHGDLSICQLVIRY